MVAEYTATELIEMLGKEKVSGMIEYALKGIQETDEYKNTEVGGYVYIFNAFSMKGENGKDIGATMVEGYFTKTESGMKDLRIKSITLTDEELPDEFVDRYNEIKKSIGSDTFPIDIL